MTIFNVRLFKTASFSKLLAEHLEQNNKWFLIESKHNGMFLGFDDEYAYEKLKTFPKTGCIPNTQIWTWEDNCLLSKTGHALEVNDWEESNGIHAITNEKIGLIDQKWRVEGDKIISYANDLALDINVNDDNSDPDIISLVEKHGEQSTQSWKFVPYSSNLATGIRVILICYIMANIQVI